LQLPLQAVQQQYRTAANARRRMRLCPVCRAPVEGAGAPAHPQDSTYVSPPWPIPAAAAAAAAAPGTVMHIPLPRPPPAVAVEAVTPAYAPARQPPPTAAEGAVVFGAALRDIVARMRAHSRDAAVQQRACEELYHMTVDDVDSQTCAGAVGAMAAVVAAMRCALDWQTEGQEWACLTCRWACAALDAMTQGHRENQSRAGDVGAIKVVVRRFRSIR